MALVGRVWGWVKPVLSYRPWGSRKGAKELELEKESELERVEREKAKEGERKMLLKIEELGPVKGAVVNKCTPQRWWQALPLIRWYWRNPEQSETVKNITHVPLKETDCSGNVYSMAPSGPLDATPTALFKKNPKWDHVILPEHYDISFNFLRHLFDLFVVGFLYVSSPAVRVCLDVFGLKGALKLWIHGMALFLVSVSGMGLLLWLVQAYLPQFALVYGVLQALVISVSVKQSLMAKAEGEIEGQPEETEDKVGTVLDSSDGERESEEKEGGRAKEEGRVPISDVVF
ncbi:uncharacterized protein C6orf47 homolog [Polyodon spathula]|uniref:uncharacterized protein C6orf47 homolog n=1 Tax=Polyodon spathula TaxID=7913 RepID=UPI001B7E70C1|nr:uncharacterized protein C6orf47 homolog [Polyodon spathula]XP_041081843.1 uncharacterized protein C6orf47 homolog [Polyodon spathula]